MDSADNGKNEIFDVRVGDGGNVALSGRCHAGNTDVLREALERLSGSVEVDFAELEYISSAGLGILLSAQKRLRDGGHALTLTNLNDHIREVFRIAGFDRVFEIR
jgi:anti-sigma B factor antagonist